MHNSCSLISIMLHTRQSCCSQSRRAAPNRIPVILLSFILLQLSERCNKIKWNKIKLLLLASFLNVVCWFFSFVHVRSIIVWFVSMLFDLRIAISHKYLLTYLLTVSFLLFYSILAHSDWQNSCAVLVQEFYFILFYFILLQMGEPLWSLTPLMYVSTNWNSLPTSKPTDLDMDSLRLMFILILRKHWHTFQWANRLTMNI